MITEIPRFTKICAEIGQEIVPGQTVYSLLVENNEQYIRRDYSADGWKIRFREFKNLTIKKTKTQKSDKSENKSNAENNNNRNNRSEEEQIIGWWKHKVPLPGDKKPKQAPNDILIKIFDELLDQWDKQEMRYVLALLLIRRRVFRLEREEISETDSGKEKKMIVYAPKTDTTYEVLAVVPDEETIEKIQTELMHILLE